MFCIQCGCFSGCAVALGFNRMASAAIASSASAPTKPCPSPEPERLAGWLSPRVLEETPGIELKLPLGCPLLGSPEVYSHKHSTL
eukprot:CAMPEP_0173183810 /NCGR_PEP_ID=MMETSP1141-20130122/8603_1 /TAXON_ID=483371 /ORGANISM="non described non described, Strain CCMP2298" /LENGTH=84 /DNA_ID=CAMNT_0014107063 /DNA_START=451 /DNA_END=705 /DNA_ORIENTATION=+